MQPPHISHTSFHPGALAPAPTLTVNPAQAYSTADASAAPSTSASAITRPTQISRNHSVTNGTLNLDPVPGDAGTTFIRPPFTDFPGSENHKGGLTYTLMAANAEWFLDVRDFVGENAVGYPTQLEPPRGWCPTKKKDAKDGWKDGEEPRLRCTFCRRTYAGVNAKSMWRRHVYEKHKVPMANRRDTGERIGGRGGRSSNKENKVATLRTVESEKAGPQMAEVEKPVRRSASMELPSLRPPAEPTSPSPSQAYAPESSTSASALAFYETTALNAPILDQELYSRVFRTPDVFDLLTSGRFDEAALCGTPPQTPGLSPSKSSASKFNIPPESPYDPLRTPAFRHSPARLPSDQPWRASSAAVNQAVRQLTLGMLVCGEASPNVRGLDVSPIVIVPASERKKRSIFSPPTQQTPGPERRLALLDALSEQEPDMLFPSPRRLFADSERTDQTSSIIARMGDFSWSSPSKDFGSSLWTMATPGGEVEDPFKAYLHLSPAPKVAGDSSPAHPPSSSTSASPASRKKSEISSIFADFLQSPTPPSGLNRSSASLSRLRYEVFPAVDKDVEMTPAEDALALAEPAALSPSTPPRLSEHSHRRSDSSSSTDGNDVPSSSAPPSSGSGKAPVSSSSSASIHSRRDSSPFQFGSHGRQRSSSSAGPSSSSSSSHKSGHNLSAATVGLMDKILGQRSQRRRTSHNHDSDVAVDAMGSPFKLGRKTSRNEFFYSLDGDCEMQEAQPKKRRKTISGRD